MTGAVGFITTAAQCEHIIAKFGKADSCIYCKRNVTRSIFSECMQQMS